jgi:hypothetical protein
MPIISCRSGACGSISLSTVTLALYYVMLYIFIYILLLSLHYIFLINYSLRSSALTLNDNHRSFKNLLCLKEVLLNNSFGLLPHVLETDRGGENNGIVSVMLRASESQDAHTYRPSGMEIPQWQLDRRPVHVVSSFRNIRAEHGWRWVNDLSLGYKIFFTDLEKKGYIDPDNPFDIAILHVAFHDQIERK